MLIHQAIYGETGGAHSLIAKSSDERSPFAELKAHTDRPGNPPPNLLWHPYLSGFGFAGYYVLSVTFPDPEASRPGMVLTHVLLADIAEVSCLASLEPLLSFLPTTPKRVTTISPITVSDFISESPGGKTEVQQHPPGMSAVVNALMVNPDITKPVVWVGQEGFTKVVSVLWSNLWPEARKNFRFRLSFGPQDIEGQEITLIATPGELENRWSGYPRVRQSDERIPDTKAEAFLLGLSGAELIQDLISELEFALAKISDLRKVEKCCDILQRLDVTSSTSEVRLLVRLLGDLSPEPEKGVAVKRKAFRRLADLTKVGRAPDVMALRNLDISPFMEGEYLLTRMVEEWMVQWIHSDSVTIARENAELIKTALIPSGTAWHKAIQESLHLALSAWRPSTASAIWHWWRNIPELLELLADEIPNGSEYEHSLVKAFPEALSEVLGEKVRVFAETRGWYVLHASSVASYCKPAEAFRRHLRIDRDSSRAVGLRDLSARVEPEDVLAAALTHDDMRLLRIAGEIAANNPRLLDQFDVTVDKWRKIWTYSVEAGANIWTGISNPGRTVHSLMDILLQDERIDPSILLAIAATPHGDLTSYPRRSEVWSKMESRVADAFVEANAEGWLAVFKLNPHFDMAVEKRLENAILNEGRVLRHLGYGRSETLSFGISLFRRFQGLTERQFINWLESILNTGSAIEPVSSALVGKLIASRRWNNAAHELYRYFSYRNRVDLVPALRECYDLLGWLDRFFLHGKLSFSITEDEWWSAFQEMATRLYPKGPGEQHVWSRSGGDISLIDLTQAGRAQWISALQTLRKGGGGRQITVESLLSEMKEDYHSNQELQVLWQNRRMS
jgi:hypothetical protein